MKALSLRPQLKNCLFPLTPGLFFQVTRQAGTFFFCWTTCITYVTMLFESKFYNIRDIRWHIYTMYMYVRIQHVQYFLKTKTIIYLNLADVLGVLSQVHQWNFVFIFYLRSETSETIVLVMGFGKSELIEILNHDCILHNTGWTF
jgi:hypothetical protein